MNSAFKWKKNTKIYKIRGSKSRTLRAATMFSAKNEFMKWQLSRQNRWLTIIRQTIGRQFFETEYFRSEKKEVLFGFEPKHFAVRGVVVSPSRPSAVVAENFELIINQAIK